MWFILLFFSLLASCFPLHSSASLLYCPMDTLADVCTVGTRPQKMTSAGYAWSQTLDTATKFAGTGALRLEVRSSDLANTSGPVRGAL